MNNSDQIPHPCKGKNGWMTVNERQNCVRVSCVLMSQQLLGRQEDPFGSLSWNEKDIIYGVLGTMEFKKRVHVVEAHGLK